MKISTLIFIFLSVSLILAVNSCKVTYPVEKQLVGRWEMKKVEKYVPHASGTTKIKGANKPAVQTPSVGPDTTQKSAKEQKKAEIERELEIQINRKMLRESRGNLEIYPDHKVVKYLGNNYVKGTWKLKKKGTQLVAKELSTSRKITLDILEINDTTAIVLEKTPYGDIKTTYVKR